MPTYRVDKHRLFVGVWTHGISIYGWPQGRADDFIARHPSLRTSKGTIRLRVDDAADDHRRRAPRTWYGPPSADERPAVPTRRTMVGRPPPTRLALVERSRHRHSEDEEAHMTEDTVEVGGHKWRLAQERRLLRFCAERGMDPNDPDLDNPDLHLLAPILDEAGEIVPDPEDLEAVK